MAVAWGVLHNEPDTRKRLEGQALLEEYSVNDVTLSSEELAWFSEAEKVVKLSITDGWKAKLLIGRICVYRRLRVQYHDTSGLLVRTEDTRGVVVPRLLTVYFSRTGKANQKVLYEETAHSLVHPVPDPADPKKTLWERYKCHLTIFEGLSTSAFFGELGKTGQRIVRGLILGLQPQCRVRLGDAVTNPCTCTL